MIARTTRIALEVVGALFALVLIVAGVLVWRVSQGPVELDFLTPPLEAALSGGEAGFDVRVGGTVLAWEGWPETFALRVRDVRVSAEGREVAQVPALDLRLSLSALASGTVAPTRVAARGAHLAVVRGPDGFRFGDAALPGDAGAEGDVSELLPALLEDLMAAPTAGRPLSYLETLHVGDASVEVHDRVLDAVWQAPSADIQLRRVPGGIDGTARLAIDLAGTRADVDAALSYARDNGRIDVAVGFDELKPAALASAIPDLADAKGITVPLSGTVSASLAPSGAVTTASANLQGGAGEIVWPVYLPDPRPVRGLSAEVTYTTGPRTLDLSQLRIDFGTSSASETDAAAAATESGDAAKARAPVLTASATARGLDGPTEVSAELGVRDLNLDELAHYWPVGLGGNARPWVVENIRTGWADKAELKADLTVPEAGFDAIELHAFGGTMAYTGLDVHYLRPLPPVRTVSGTAIFDDKSLTLQAHGGTLASLRVPRADIAITGLDTTDHRIAIDLDVGGRLRDALDILDHPRLDLIEPLGLDPATVSGRIETARLRFRFPLLADLTFDETEVSAEADLRDARVEDFVFGLDADAGRFDLRVDKAGMTLDGPVELGGVPLTMSWREAFGAQARITSTIDATVPRLDAEDRAKLGLGLQPFVEGPVSANVSFQSYRNEADRVRTAVNLKDAVLDVPFAAWRKPAGDAGTAEATLRLADGRPTALESFAVEAGGDQVERLAASGSARFGGEGGDVKVVELARFDLGRTELRDIVAEHRSDGWYLVLQSGVLDLKQVLGEGVLRGDEDGEPQVDAPAIEIEASRLDRVYFAQERYVERVSLHARRGTDGWWRRLRIDGEAPARFHRAARGDGTLPAPPDGATAAPFRVNYQPGPDGRRRLEVTAQDSGAMMRALDVFDNVEGGQMRITGEARGKSPASPVDAQVEVSDFRLVNASTLARILTLASFTGINNVLQGEGIAFDRLDGSAVYDHGTLSTELLHAYGPALGVTTKGSVDLDADSLALSGVVVPAASTNRVLGNIPVLGQLLTGGEGEGLFAVSYDVSGDLMQPEVNVNPLSALAPGFLRGLFGRLGDLKGSPPPEDWPRASPE